MGVNLYDKLRFDEIISSFQKKSELDIIELGVQWSVVNNICDPNFKFREQYTNTFKSWRTLDLHYSEGIELFDLSILSNESKTADIITNFGTSEHVEPQVGQYNCWINLHNMLKIGGYILHTLPPSNGGWEDHCRYYHDSDFFLEFEKYGYEIIEIRQEWNQLLLCTMKKIEDSEFMTIDRFFSKITFDEKSSNEIHWINNPKNLTF